MRVDGVLNFRDAGGMPAGAGSIRAGVVFRSGHLARVQPGGVRVLQELGIRRIVDLRDDLEVAALPTPPPLRELALRAPVFAGSMESFLAQDHTLAEVYRRMVDDSGPRLVAAVRALTQDWPALIHCTAGKDRTGVAIALALSAAGADLDAVVADYARSESSLPPARHAQVRDYLRRTYPGSRHAEELAVCSPAPVMRRLLGDVTERFGGVPAYLIAHGMAGDEVDDLRRILWSGPVPSPGR
ncbi:tyrosine-protein phosphatase [Microbacterium sp.]|uniref:tyrosine-protein phosphatase n=1 Tax=Microbacterium sp. TaxID=51671 RepID=UPI003A85FAFA